MKTDKELLIEGIKALMESLSGRFDNLIVHAPDIDSYTATEIVECYEEYKQLEANLNDLEDGE